MRISPVFFINGIISAAVGVILSQFLIYAFAQSIVMGFILLIVYIFLGVMAYRFAHVHTKAQRQAGDDDWLAREGIISPDEYMARHPNG